MRVSGRGRLLVLIFQVNLRSLGSEVKQPERLKRGMKDRDIEGVTC